MTAVNFSKSFAVRRVVVRTCGGRHRILPKSAG
jgi:hypothetical protein